MKVDLSHSFKWIHYVFIQKIHEVITMKNEKLYFFRIRDKCFAYSINTAQCVSIDDISLSILPRLLDKDPNWIYQKFAPVFSKKKINSCIEQCLTYLQDNVINKELKLHKLVIPGDINIVQLHISHDCNLRCDYCYAKGGSFGKRTLMSVDVLTKAIDFKLNNSGDEEKIRFGFFGGEPLLNFNVIKTGVNYAKRRAIELKKEINFSIVTNATLLNQEIMDFLYQDNFSIIFSIDGPKCIHDRHRKSTNGKGTHSRVLQNIIKYSTKYSEDFTVRGTYTSITPNFSEQVLFLNNLGFNAIAVEEAQLPEKHPYSIYSQSDILRIQREYDKLADIFLEWFDEGKQFHFIPFENCFMDIISPQIQHRPCGGGINSIAIDPDGRIFPCFEAVAEVKNQIGNIDNGFDDKKRLLFQGNHVDKYPSCQDCWLKYSCGGGCYALNIRYNNNIGKPYQPNCELTKYRYMISSWIVSKIIERGEDAVLKLKSNLGI